MGLPERNEERVLQAAQSSKPVSRVPPITVTASTRDLAVFPFRPDVVTSFRSPEIPEQRSVRECAASARVWRGAAQEGWNSQAIMCVPNLLP